MDTSLAILFLGLLIFSAYLFHALFSLTKVPSVLLLLTIGLVVGPVLNLVNPSDFGAAGPVFTGVTLVIILFESGTNLKLGETARSFGPAFFVTLFNFLVSTAVAGGVAWTFFSAIDPVAATFFGVIVGGTSSAIVIPMVKQLRIHEKGQTILVLESAISDVLCLVAGLALLAAMQQGVFDAGRVLNAIWRSFLFALASGLAAGLAWSALLGRLRRMQNYTFSNLAIVFIVYGVTERLGWNGGIAALGFGIAMGNAQALARTWAGRIFPAKELLTVEKNFFAELAFIIQTYFFVYVGLSIPFSGAAIYLAALLIVVLIVAARPLSVRLFVRTPMPVKDLSVMSLMAPKGLVPAILASLPLQLGLPGGKAIQNLAYAVVLLSIVLCTILIIWESRKPEEKRITAERCTTEDRER